MKGSPKRPYVRLTRLIAVILTVVLMSSSLSGCKYRVAEFIDNLRGNQLGTTVVTDPRPLEVIGEELFLFMLAGDYSSYHQLIADPSTYNFPRGFVAPEPTFGDYSYEADLEAYDYFARLLKEVKAYDPASLKGTELRLYNYLSFFLESTLPLKPYFYYSDPYEPSMGLHIEVPLVLTTFEFRTQQDIDDYLKLVADIPRFFDQANVIVDKRAAVGYFPNLAAIESAIEEAEVYIAPLSSNLLVTSFENSLNSGKGPFAKLTEAQRKKYAETNRDIVSRLVIPAYENVIEVLLGLALDASYETSLASYPNARKYYAAKLRADGFDVSPEEAIAILDKGIDKLFAQAGNSFVKYDPAAWDRVAKKNLPADATAMIEFLNTKSTAHFPDIGKRPFTVKSASNDEVIKGILAFYMFAPVDDLTANHMVYYSQNISDTFSLATTLGHESFPGHLYQYNYFGLTKPQPIEYLAGTTAYAEGFAIYGEYYTLLYMGFSEEEARVIDGYEKFWRILEARLDLGINYEGWTARQTSQYLAKWGLGSAGEGIFQAVASNPLVSVPYGLGPLEFIDLLETAQAKLGKSFDFREFHKVLLQDGALPMDLLRKNVYDWLKM